MEDPHLSQMVNWLDEEQRKSKAELLRLQQRAEGQETALKEQDRRLKALEARQTGLPASLAQNPQLEQALEQLKSEVVLLLDKSEERRQQAEREAERIRQAERENQAQAANEFKKELEKLRQAEDNIITLRAENQRLGEAFQKIQQDFTELRKQVEESARSIASLQDLGKRNETQLINLQLLINDLKQEQAHTLESIRFSEQDRQRQMSDWTQEAEAYRNEIKEYRARMQLYTEQHERGRKAFDTLQEFREQMEREQHQITELQRLSEERQRALLEEWQQEEDKRRQMQQQRWEQQWAEHMRQSEKQEELLTQLHEQAKEQGRLVSALLQAQEELAQLNVTTAREWQMRFEELAG